MRWFLAMTLAASLFASCAREATPIVRIRKPVKRDPSKIVGVDLGNQFPAYTTQMLDGGTLDLAQLRGRVVLLNVWATWCAPCRAETPALIDIQNQYRDRGLKVVGVSVDESGLDQVKDFV